MKGSGTGFILAVLLSAGCTTSSPQAARISPQISPPAQCSGPETSPALAATPGYREIDVVVSGKGLAGVIAQSDFALYQGKKRLPLLMTRTEPVSLGILVDASGSMEPKLRDIEPLIVKLIENLNPQDQIFVATFSRKLVMLHDFTTDRQTIIDELQIARPYGATALYDAVIESLRRLAKGCYSRRALVVISDGADNASVFSLSEAKASAKQSRARIFSMVVELKAWQQRDNYGNYMSHPIPSYQQMDESALVALAAETGAQTFLVAPDDVAATPAADSIAAALNRHYRLGYVAPGNRGPLRVEIIGHPGASAHIVE